MKRVRRLGSSLNFVGEAYKEGEGADAGNTRSLSVVQRVGGNKGMRGSNHYGMRGRDERDISERRKRARRRGIALVKIETGT